MKAIRINPWRKEIRYIELPAARYVRECLTALQERVGGPIEGVALNDHMMYVDEEALLKRVRPPRFSIAGKTIWGNAVITGPADRNGYDTEVKLELEAVQKMVTFL